MKEANTLINSVICLQLFLPNIFGGPICKTGNPVTDDIKRIDELTDTCWLHLTVPEMSFSLDILSDKFAKNSSNYLIIEKLHRILDGIHNCLSEDGKDYVDESEYTCEKSNMEPRQYFNYFNEIIGAFQSAEDSSPCDSDVICRVEGPDTGRVSNSTLYTLEQITKTCVPRCEHTHPERGRPVRAKRHSLTANQPISDLNHIKGGCINCATLMDHFSVILITVACTGTITVILTCLIVQTQKNRRTRSSIRNPTDNECEAARWETEQHVQFITENQDSCT
ncbi:kit ligand a isoform X3 [Mobula birostris]|uniref:kit ligand a isoform X3 n=1 Tax=Mobula birostris TaxID=1983395 RepID=UPI003B28B346